MPKRTSFPNQLRISISLSLVALVAVMAAFVGSCGSSSRSSGTSPTPDIQTLISNLQAEGFTVAEGKFVLTDAIDLYNRGLIINCNANNAKNLYFVPQLPPAPGQMLPNAVEDRVYPLRADEAILIVGKTPPPMKYFSYRSFLAGRYSPPLNNYQKIYASMGDCINIKTISTESTPNGADGNPYNQQMVIISTADRGTDTRVRAACVNAGYPSLIINTDIIPSSLLKMGLNPGNDLFTFLARTAMFIDEPACEAYQQNPGVRTFRLTPKNQAVLDPFTVPELRRRGTGMTEMDLMPYLEDLRRAILAKYPNYKATELQTEQWLEEPYMSVQAGKDELGESRDTTYLRTNHETEFTLSDSPDDFVIVYGVNHTQTGKCTYNNFVIYGAQVFNGVASVDDKTLLGSADDYIPGHANADKLYAWKVARHANGDPHCLEVQTGSQAYGIPLTDPAFVGFRSYIEPSTKVGPAYNELIYDRAIHFTAK